MSYNASITDSTFSIPKEFLEDARKAALALYMDTCKRPPWAKPPDAITDLLSNFQFSFYWKDDSLVFTDYNGRFSFAERLFQEIGEYGTGYVEWVTEDHLHWRWVFPEFKIYRGRVVWDAEASSRM